jgi:acyl carrier protein
MTTRSATDANTDETRLRQIIARVAKVAPDAFGRDDDLRIALGLDSLSALRVTAVSIPDSQLHELRTLRAMRDFLDGYGGTPGQNPERFTVT